jgi:hypothetical protein
MKPKHSTLLIILSIIAVSCSTKSGQEVTQEQKSSIMKEISSLWESSSKGFEDLNVDPLFSYFSESKDAKVITYGTLHTDIAVLKKQFTNWFESPNAVRRKAISDPVYFDFINEKTVLMTAIVSFQILNDTSSIKQITKSAYTLLWVKEPNGWKALNMHASQQ